jgi:glycosyltransferase involved in cell wall biosynthesis
VTDQIRVALLEPYYGGSHKTWADGYYKHSVHNIDLITMPARFWKWRMQGGAISMARLLHTKPDVILASSMIDLSIFRSLTYRSLGDVPIATYFHENQLSYPQSQRQGHGWRYGFINYVSSLVADKNFFNSDFHLKDFMEQLPRMLKHFADYRELQVIDEIRAKSAVLPVGMDLHHLDQHKIHKPPDDIPLIVWNHRWEDDKNPQAFIESMLALNNAGYNFSIAITGENFQNESDLFTQMREQLKDKIIQYGFMESYEDYAQLLWQADYVVSTANQEFFGISICEAIYCNCIPILPNRLNYPNLLPDDAKSACLYKDGKLTALLKHHLDKTIHVDTTPLKHKIAQYDWTIIAPQYDKALAQVMITPHH